MRWGRGALGEGCAVRWGEVEKGCSGGGVCCEVGCGGGVCCEVG